MRSRTPWISLLLLALGICGASVAQAEAPAETESDLALLIPQSAGDRQAVLDAGVVLQRDIGTAMLIRGGSATLDVLADRFDVRRLPSPHQLQLAGGAIDPRAHRLDLSSPEGMTPVLVALDGPWDPTWVETLEARGANLSGLVPPYAALLRATPEQLRAIEALPFVLSVVAYEPSWRISSRANDAFSLPTPQTYQILGFPGADLDRVAEQVAARGVLLARGTLLDKPFVEGRLNGAAVRELAALPEVEWVDIEPEGRSLNEKARVIMQTERTWNSTPPANLDFYNPVYGIGVYGESQIIAVTDDGLNDAHDVFAQSSPPKLVDHYVPDGLDCGVFPTVDATLDDPLNHGTPVTCSAAGNDAGTTDFMSPNLYDGVAFRSQVIMQAIAGPAGEFCVPDPYIDVIQDRAYDEGARVHNNSWGHGPIPDVFGGTQREGTYSALSQALDAWLYDPAHSDSVQVFAAGNFGALWSNSSVYRAESLSDEGHAKNPIIVGASKNGDFRHEMYVFSSRGPTDEGAPFGRVKPDVVAPGEFLMSADATDDSGYWDPGEGTRAAAPEMNGAAKLVPSPGSQ